MIGSTALPIDPPHVTSVRYFTSRPRRQPKLGDRRTTKKHGEQVRVFQQVRSGPHAGAFVTSRGRQCYEWVSPEEAYRQWPHLRPREERSDA